MLIFYAITYKSSDTPYVITWSFLATIGWLITRIIGKKILLVKRLISEEIFEQEN